jgi:autoinducer 2-degrading protein
MVIQSIRYSFAPEDADEVAGIFTELRDLSRKEPGVVRFDVARSEEKPNVFVLWEEYRDEAARKAHFETEHFERLAVNGIRRLAKDRIGEIAVPLA